MPIMWRYLLSNYLRILILSLAGFITVMLVTRLDTIANFASFGANIFDVTRFILYQLPYILPIALPISCLISSVILFQKLSSSHELTALRAAGIGLHHIIAPILIAGGFLAVFNFYVSSEIATYSHMSTRKMYNEISKVNPLTLIQNSHLLKTKGIYVDLNSSRTNTNIAENVVIASRNNNESRMNLMIAKQMIASEDLLEGKTVSIISNKPSKNKGGNSSLNNDIVIDNIDHFSNSAQDISKLIHKAGWKLDNDHLKLRLLLIKVKKLKEKLQISTFNSQYDLIKSQEKALFAVYSEITRRLSIALAALTFTIIGASFGINIQRRPTKKGIITIVSLATLFLASFFIAKGMKDDFYLASILFISPHILMTYLSIKTIKKVNRGIE